MPIPPRRPKFRLPGEEPTRNRMCWIHCGECGKGVCLSIGCNAEFMTMDQKLACLVKIGWRVAPNIRCERCKRCQSILYFHPESDCLFWSKTPCDEPLLIEVGRASVESRSGAYRLFKANGDFVDMETFNKCYKGN